MDAASREPADPEARKPAPVETWYPDSLSAETAVRLTLYPGERREDLTIKVRRLRPRCMEGTLADPNGPAPLSFSVQANALGGRVASDSKAAPDGRVRICGVPRVEFHIYVYGSAPGVNQLASAVIPAGDKDVAGLRITATSGTVLHGQVIWGGQPRHNKRRIGETLDDAPV